jgi:integrase
VNVRHHHATPLADLPALLRRLEARKGVSAHAARFAILTAARLSEVLGARWSEIQGDVWTIPAARYKTGQEHCVPLSTAARTVLATTPREQGNPFVFISGIDAGRHLSITAIFFLLRRMGLRTTLHGTARSTFSDWAHNETAFEHQISLPAKLATCSLLASSAKVLP